MRPIFRGISSCTSYWLLPENVLVFLFSRALFRELSFHAIFGLHYNPLCIFPLSRSCSEHFLLMLSTSSHYNPSYPYPSSYTVYTMSTLPSLCTSTLKMEAAESSKILVSTHHTTQCNNPENCKFKLLNEFKCQHMITQCSKEVIEVHFLLK